MEFVLVLATIGLFWFTVRTMIEVAKSSQSDNAKASWILLVLLVPIIGTLVFWLFTAGEAGAKREGLSQRRGGAKGEARRGEGGSPNGAE